MKLHIDWTACDGRGACVELMPEVLDQDPWGYPIPKDGGNVPAEAQSYARKAVAYCPRLALRLLHTG